MRNIAKTAAALLGLWSLGAAAGTNVYINGQELDYSELVALQNQLRTQVQPGYYLVDYSSGCWVNTTSGTSGCVDANGTYTSRYGSGGYSSDGSWNHWSDAAGGAVGGTGDGCLYTSFGWSNC
jgi:hypothetical protein